MKYFDSIGLLAVLALFGCAQGTEDSVFNGGGNDAGGSGGGASDGGSPSNGGAPSNGGDSSVTSTTTNTSTTTTSTTTNGTSCGDFACNGTETCGTCPTDCGACPPTCGDGTCAAGETMASCPQDCGGGGSCTHDPCQIGAPLDPSCDPCADLICNGFGQTTCCTSSWDDVCALFAEVYCGCTP